MRKLRNGFRKQRGFQKQRFQNQLSETRVSERFGTRFRNGFQNQLSEESSEQGLRKGFRNDFSANREMGLLTLPHLRKVNSNSFGIGCAGPSEHGFGGFGGDFGISFGVQSLRTTFLPFIFVFKLRLIMPTHPN